MPGTNAGTGEPIAFRCAKQRRSRWWQNNYDGYHRAVRTGRQRYYHRRGQGIRTMREAFEYRCSCGHVGWSAHVDVLRLPCQP